MSADARPGRGELPHVSMLQAPFPHACTHMTTGSIHQGFVRRLHAHCSADSAPRSFRTDDQRAARRCPEHNPALMLRELARTAPVVRRQAQLRLAVTLPPPPRSSPERPGERKLSVPLAAFPTHHPSSIVTCGDPQYRLPAPKEDLILQTALKFPCACRPCNSLPKPISCILAQRGASA
jgi:hypothetical protein